MGNVSADGRQLWLSGRFDDEVYVFDTQTGKVERIPVGLLYRWTGTVSRSGVRDDLQGNDLRPFQPWA